VWYLNRLINKLDWHMAGVSRLTSLEVKVSVCMWERFELLNMGADFF
jgi:hypothetical protein